MKTTRTPKVPALDIESRRRLVGWILRTGDIRNEHRLVLAIFHGSKGGLALENQLREQAATVKWFAAGYSVEEIAEVQNVPRAKVSAEIRALWDLAIRR